MAEEEIMPLCPQQPFNIGDFTSTTDSSQAMPSASYLGSSVLEITVKSCSKIRGTESHDNDIYRNCSIPRGYAYIANFNTFPDSPYGTRPGSSKDVSNLSELFVQMGYGIVGPYDNLTKFELIKTMEAFRDNDAFSKVDSCVVAIMSHGKGDKHFLTSDNKSFSYHDVLEMFNNQQAPLLLGKPKVFIFQSCRGPLSDSGVGPMPSFIPSPTRQAPQRDGVALGHTGTITSTPSFTDMYIIFSSVPGFVSYRCPDRGSWLIENICVEFMEHACNKDLESLMKLVSRRLKSLSSDKGKKQSCETRNIGFDKHLFFNPQSSLNSMNEMMDALPTVPTNYVDLPPISCHQNETRLPNPVSIFGSYSQSNAGGDVVDSPARRFGLPAMEFHLPSDTSCSGLKRQLSSSTNSEALRYCNALKGYLKVHDMPDLAACLKSVENELQNQKRQKKGRKPTETQSQGF